MITSSSEGKAELRRVLTQTRERTLDLLAHVPEAYLKRRVHDFYSPIGWHFGHVAMTEEFWVCEQALQKPCRDEALRFLFTNIPENPKDNRTALPERAEILRYMAESRQRVLELLETAEFDAENPLLRDGYAWEFALQHECQHQETILEMLTLIWQAEEIMTPIAPVDWKRGTISETRRIAGGTFVMGSDDYCGYDNEKRAHEVTVETFRLDTLPVTAFEWTEFIADGGYLRSELWTPEGWAWRTQNQIERPEYWLNPHIAGQWACWSFAGLRAIEPDEPAASISGYEAEAYARWAGKRLPTESEWEYAARQGVTESPRVWDWTQTIFAPYPGFAAFPYDGYSLEHFDGRHRVCRGGSWATAAPILRPSFRNWYVPSYRQGFLGVRCAAE